MNCLSTCQVKMSGLIFEGITDPSARGITLKCLAKLECFSSAETKTPCRGLDQRQGALGASLWPDINSFNF